MTPRISVVTTVYNGAPYVDRAIPSILGQSFEDFEWVLVDDGSTDGTADVLADLARRDTRVRVFSPGRLGISGAANFGVGQARSEYVARQDFDDRSYPDRLRLQVEALDANPRVGVVGCHYVVVDENRDERYVRMPPAEHGAIVASMAKGVPFANTLVAFRRQAWTDAGGYPSVGDLEDLLLWIRIAKGGWQFATIATALGEHFVHPSSFFHRTFRYAERQRALAKAQAQAVRQLDLPKWMYVYPLGRYSYAYCPTPLKRLMRRTLAGSQERDL